MQHREDELARADAARVLANGSDSELEAEDKAERGDLLMRELPVTDVSVIAPTAPSHVRAAAVQCGAADKRDCTKRIKYRKRGNFASTFVPLSVETYGTLGQPFMTLLSDLARRATTHDAAVTHDPRPMRHFVSATATAPRRAEAIIPR